MFLNFHKKIFLDKASFGLHAAQIQIACEPSSDFYSGPIKLISGLFQIESYLAFLPLKTKKIYCKMCISLKEEIHQTFKSSRVNCKVKHRHFNFRTRLTEVHLKDRIRKLSIWND